MALPPANILKRDNPNTLQPWIVEVVASMTTLAVVAVSLRMFSRYLKRNPWWWDDWVILFSLSWNLAVVGFIFAMYFAGMGIHSEQVPVKSIVMMAKWLLVAEILYAWNLCLTKIAVLLMYYRIFRFPFFKKMAYGVGAFIVIWGITITFVFIFICTPVQKVWYPNLPGSCVNQVGTWIANAASTILTDVVILLLPIHEIWKLQLRKFEKIAVSITFSLGFFVVFASAYRFSVLFTYDSSDPTYTLAPTVGWTSIEMSAGIVSACLPVLRPVIQLLGAKVGIHSLFSHDGSRNETAESRSRIGRHTSNREIPGAHLDFESRDSRDAWLDENEVSFERLVEPIPLKLRPEHGFVHTVESTHDGQSGDQATGYSNRPLGGIKMQTQFTHYVSYQ